MTFSVLLVNPPVSYRKENIVTANLGLSMVAAYVKNKSNFKVSILDARFDNLCPEEAAKKILKIAPAILGFSLCVHEPSEWINEVLSFVKRGLPSIHVSLGNYFPSLFPEKALDFIPQADSIVIGEGEVTFLDLASSFAVNGNWQETKSIAYRDKKSNKIIQTPRRSLIKDLDELPFAERYLVQDDGTHSEFVIEGARGCYFSCSFCAISPFYGLSSGIKLRTRSAENIFNEMFQIKTKYPEVKSYRFVDPDFISSICKSRSEKLAKLLIKKLPGVKFKIDTRAASVISNIPLLKLLKKAGLAKIGLGVEAGSQRMLDKMNKKTTVEQNIMAANILRELGIDYSYGFMMITPWSTEQDIEENVNLLKKIGRVGVHCIFHELTLIPGSAAFNEMQAEKRLDWSGKLYYFSYETGSKRIEHYRKLKQLFYKRFPLFFANMSFISESIRQLYHEERLMLAQSVEGLSNELVLELFNDFWAQTEKSVSSEDSDIDFISNCHTKYLQRVEALLRKTNPEIPLPCPAGRLPTNAPWYHV